jgi:hypothetical protein
MTLSNNGYYRLPDGTPVQAVRIWGPTQWKLYALPRRSGAAPLYLLERGHWYRLVATHERDTHAVAICDLTTDDLRVGLRD